jgi:hypothetical protein
VSHTPTKTIAPKKLLGLRTQVVEPFSAARYFGEPYKVPFSDHFSIAKPAGRTAVQHLELVHFIETCLSIPVRAKHSKTAVSESYQGDKGAQTILASGSGEVRSLSQTMAGGGKQTVRVSGKAKVSGVTQKKT